MFEKIELTEKSEWSGTWWFPTSNTRFEAVLILDPHGSSFLKALGNDMVPSLFEVKEDRILGEVDGKKLTLNFSEDLIPRAPYSLIEIDKAFLGHHINKIEDIKVSEVQFRIKNLASWAALANELNTYFEKESQPPPFTFILPDLEGEITFEYPLDNFRREPGIHLQNDNYYQVVLKYRLSKSVIDVLNEVEYFNNLITLLTYSTTYPLTVNLKLDDRTSVDVFYQSRAFTPNYNKIRNFPALVPFSKIQTKFGLILANWFKFYEGEKYLTYNLITHLRGKNYFVEDTFMHIISSLEAYHRKYVREEKDISQNTLRLLEKIKGCDKLNRREKDKIENALDESRLTLKERLDELIADSNAYVKEFENINTEKCGSTRNYIAHIDKKGKDVFSSSEMIKVANQLALLLAMKVLKEIGIEEFSYQLHLSRKAQILFN